MSEWCGKYGIEIWSYCLMPNHVHLIAVPKTEDGLSKGVGEAHRRYTRYVNFYKKWRGYLWRGRFHSCPLDLKHLMMAARYIEQNPVRAKMVDKEEDYVWSSARAHIEGKDDVLVRVNPLLERVKCWKEFLEAKIGVKEIKKLQHHERIGRPLGEDSFIHEIEEKLGRDLAIKHVGRPKKLLI